MKFVSWNTTAATTTDSQSSTSTTPARAPAALPDSVASQVVGLLRHRSIVRAATFGVVSTA